MPYISLSMAELDKRRSEETANHDDDKARRKQKKIFRHPVRNRIIGILRDGVALTQQELGKALSMSNAAVHYHVKLLIDVGIVKLHSTRMGPNGIQEKLYTVCVEQWPGVSMDDLDFYLKYTVSWMNERHREGLNILESEDFHMPFITGSYSARASLEEIKRFKRRIEEVFNEFFEQCEASEPGESVPFAVTFALLPSREKNDGDGRHVLEFEPK
ncbi:MAG: helix-turn-helix domain-containing protein [Desulfatitalea sp.]|nr:helix-turn-helix domain-containing protein [Desulfatitalea sp.]NNK00283.1 helix-turn-helix domain-containing protein [Desulfatitalea sp.]